jgi:hypothetical protein
MGKGHPLVGALALAVAACGANADNGGVDAGSTMDGAGGDATTNTGDSASAGDAASGDAASASDGSVPTGPVYYVATTGSDSNSGKDVDHPFLTITKAASVAVAGDTVVIRAGVYRESVTLPHSGAAGSPIAFQSYPGETVTVSGADVIPSQSWTVHSGSIYQASMAWTLGVGNDQVFVDGAMMNEARWPNTSLDVSNPHVAVATTISIANPTNATVTLGDPALTQAAGFWNGAHVNMGAGKVWVYNTYTVTSSATGQLVFGAGDASSSAYAPAVGNPYYLWGTLAALDAAGEWYHDATAQTLYLWAPAGDSPGNHLVEAKRRQVAFDFAGQSYVIVRGLRIFAASVTMGAASHDDVVDGVQARYVSHAAVLDGTFQAGVATTGFLVNGTNNRVTNCAISFSSGNGVMLNGTGHTVSNCLVHDVDYVPSDCGAVYPAGGSGITIEGNTFYNSGRALLLLRNISASKALHNHIYSAGLQAQDLGGIYTWGTDGAGTEIAYNVVHHIEPFYYHKIGGGIYLDNNSSNYVVHHNVAYDVSTNPLVLNTVSTNNLVYNNTFIGSTIGTGSAPGVKLTNDIVTGTITVGTGATQTTNLVGISPDPMFVQPDAGNYQLLDGSPAIDKGTVLSPYTDGYVGSAPDIGAFEFGASPWTAGSSITSDGF